MDVNVNTNSSGAFNFDTASSVQTNGTNQTTGPSVKTPIVNQPPVDNMSRSDQTQLVVTAYAAPTQNPQLPKPGEAKPIVVQPLVQPNAGKPGEGKPGTQTQDTTKHTGSIQTTGLQDQPTDQSQVQQQQQDQGGQDQGQSGGQGQGGDSGGQGSGSDSGSSGSNQGGSKGGSQGGAQDGSQGGLIPQEIVPNVQVGSFQHLTAVNLSVNPSISLDSVGSNSGVGAAAPTKDSPSTTATTSTDPLLAAFDNVAGILHASPVTPLQLSQNLVSISQEIQKIASAMVASMPEGADKFRYADFLTKIGNALRQVQSMLQEMQCADSAQADKLSKAQLDMHLHQINAQREEMDKTFQKQMEALAKQATLGLLSKIFAFLIPLLVIILAPIMIPLLLLMVVSSGIWAPIVGAVAGTCTAMLAAEFIDCCATVAGQPTFAMDGLMSGIETVLGDVFGASASPEAKQKIAEILKSILMAVCLTLMVVIAMPQMILGGIMMITDMMQKTHVFGDLVKAAGGTDQQVQQADSYAALAVSAIFAIVGIVACLALPFMEAEEALEVVEVAADTAMTVVEDVGASVAEESVETVESLVNELGEIVGDVAGEGGEIIGGIGQEEAGVSAEVGSAGEGSQAALSASGKVLTKGSQEVVDKIKSGAQEVIDKIKSILKQLLDPQFLLEVLMDTSTVAVDVVQSVNEYKMNKLKAELAILQGRIDSEFQLTEAHIKILKKVIQDLLDSMGGFAKELGQVAALNKKIISGQSNVIANLFSGA